VSALVATPVGFLAVCLFGIALLAAVTAIAEWLFLPRAMYDDDQEILPPPNVRSQRYEPSMSDWFVQR
jgi:hypothetical protein